MVVSNHVRNVLHRSGPADVDQVEVVCQQCGRCPEAATAW
jgi:hypothetical protein